MGKVFAIGALGGSGTRVIAQILREIGIDFGNVLNYPNDNLLFTTLFKNPKWYQKSSQSDIERRLKIFHKYMIGDRLTLSDYKELLSSSLFNKTIGRDYRFYYKILFCKRSLLKNNAWGWKEPNSQLYINEINNFFQDIKYIHVLRNGLDMAFSDNKYQLKNWGFKYDIYLDESDDFKSIAIKQLDYWICSTKEVLKNSSNLKNRFYLLNYADFCLDSDIELERLIHFVGIDVSPNRIRYLRSLFKKQKSFNRYKKYDISIFRKDQIEFVRSVGFEVVV